jgi:hypothetical protein
MYMSRSISLDRHSIEGFRRLGQEQLDIYFRFEIITKTTKQTNTKNNIAIDILNNFHTTAIFREIK